MLTQGPFDLTLNQLLPLNDPGATSNNPATAVQVQNASPFIIEVNSGGDVLTIQPFTAQTVNTSGGGQQMSVTPIQTGTSGQQTAPKSVTVVWLLAGESAPMVDGPLTASALSSILSSQGIGGVNLVTVTQAVASGASANFGGVAAGSYRLWNWGWFPHGGVSGVSPTSGVLELELIGSVGGATDMTSYDEPASNRLAGMIFQASSTPGWGTLVNYTNQEVTGFMTYSAA